MDSRTYREKKETIRSEVKQLLKKAGDNPDAIDSFELIADNEIAVFCKPSGITPKGLTNDLLCQSKPVIEYNIKSHELKYLKNKNEIFD